MKKSPITRHLSYKLLHVIIVMIIVYLIAFGVANAQSEQLNIPLSNPGKPGTLTVQLVNGSITVKGYDGKEVIVQPTGEHQDEEITPDGLRKISGKSFGLEAIEDNNNVHIKSTSPNSNVKLEVQVPYDFSVKVKTVNNGRIRIEKVKGEIEATNINGDVRLTDISGSAVANTINGEITATFDAVTPNTPMSFTSLNGDIEVTFPASVKMTARLKSANGEIFTDFDMNISMMDQRETSNEQGVYKVKVDKQVTGEVNGGGPTMFFETHNGDVIIRKH